jgi:predicted metal-dependent hydrolase
VRNTTQTQQNFSIFPQPFTQQVQISLPKNASKSAKIEVYNSQGRWIKSYNANQESEISTENWPAGVYFFYFLENGQRQIFKGIKVAQ